MKLTYIDDGRYVTIETDSLDALYDKRDEHLGEQKRKAFATDMDGVLEPDDLAITKYDILYPVNGVEKFQEISNAVLVPAREGRCPYGFTLVVAADHMAYYNFVQDSVGKHVRLTPGALEFISAMKVRHKNVTAATCAYKWSAKRVCDRLGITDCLSIEFGISELEKFTGGYGKTKAVREWLAENGLSEDELFFLGDSWTDFNPLQDFRKTGSVAFNPKYRELNQLASVNIYSSDLRGVFPIFDMERCGFEETPAWVVFNGEEPKSDELVEEELSTAQQMRDEINEKVEAKLPKAEMLSTIREELCLPNGFMNGVINLDVPDAIERTIERYHDILQELKA